ncbi:Carbohydrate sulfotransferase 5, partial [Operophtera brumata]
MLRRVNFYLCFAFGSLCFLIYGFLEGLLQANPTNPYDGSPDIDEILDKTRSKIKIDLLNYNFTSSGVHKLEDLILEASGKPVRSVIISTWRSGTSFLGEVVNAMPGNFYHYEPLLSYGVIQIRGAPLADNAISTIKKLLKCHFSGMGYYFEYGKKHSDQFQSNTRLWDYCKYNKELCFDANFTARFCKLLNAKVVLLIRDPRGTMQSRQHCSFCPPAADCWKPELLCADMISDY